MFFKIITENKLQKWMQKNVTQKWFAEKQYSIKMEFKQNKKRD